MDEIFNHDLNRGASANPPRPTGRARVPPPGPDPRLTVAQQHGSAAAVRDAQEGKDPFNDFPMPQRRHYGDHPAMRGELSVGLQPPAVDLGGHDMVGHHRAPLSNAGPSTGVPNYPGARQPDASGGPFEPRAHPPASGRWQTTAQAQMAGDATEAKRRGGKKMAAFAPGQAGAGGAGSLIGYQGPHGGYAGGMPFAQRAAPLQDRVDPLHNQVDQRGGLALETLPFVPGYGGHVPEARENLSVAVDKSLRPRPPKDLLVENFSNKMSGCTKITQVGRR